MMLQRSVQVSDHSTSVICFTGICRRLTTTKQWLDESTGLQKQFAWLLHQLARASWHYLMKGKANLYQGDLKLKALEAEMELKRADLERMKMQVWPVRTCHTIEHTLLAGHKSCNNCVP